MKTVRRREGETLVDLVRRCYTTRWIDGFEREERLEQASEAVRRVNPEFDKQETVQLPSIAFIPYLETTVTDVGRLHETVHARLEAVQADERLLKLSFVDPLRLGCEELGVAVTPAVALEVHRRLRGVLSFDQGEYEEVRNTNRPLHGIRSIHWKPGG